MEKRSSSSLSRDSSVTLDYEIETSISTPLGDGIADISSSSPSRLQYLCRRLWWQRTAWYSHFHKHAAAILMGLSLQILVITLIVLRCIFYPGDLPAFSISAGLFFIISFVFLWTAVPEGPPLLAAPSLNTITN